MKSFLKNILSTLIGMVASVVIIILLFAGIITMMSSKEEVMVKANSILKIDLSNTSVVERKSENPFEGLKFYGEVGKKIELKQVLDNIEKAKTDENIKAIYINTSFVNAGLSQTEEIRNKLLEFKKTKKIISYSEVYSQSAYYLASVANKIYLNPEGIIEIKGLSVAVMFYKGLLEKLDVDMQIIRHGRFKSAVEPFTLQKMSPANRQQMTLFLSSIADNIMDSIASQRDMTLSEIHKHANNLSLENAKICFEFNYVDALLYQDQIEDSLLKISGGEKLNLISLNKYSDVKINQEDISRNKIAIIYATGTINSGKGDEKSIGSETTAKAIKQAREDKNVKAIVFRINSGGGSALASDVIWRETILTKKAKKPIIVSMGDYAASGGYYIACAADSIVANPTTLTGSIGVFGMVPNLQNFYKNKLGITIDTVNTNTHSDIGTNRPLSQFERNKIQKNVSDMYSGFIYKVGEGRGMSTAAVDEIGQGRIWTGFDAKLIGLIDTYGGIEKAIEIAALMAKIEDYRIISLPEKKDPFAELVLKIAGETSVSDIVMRKLGFRTKLIDPIQDLLKADGIQARIPFIMQLK